MTTTTTTSLYNHRNDAVAKISSSSSSSSSSLKKALSEHTSFFGLRLWVLILTSITLISLLLLLVLCLFIVVCRCCRSRRKMPSSLAASASSKLLLAKVSDAEMNALGKPPDQLPYELPTRVSSGVGIWKSGSRTMQCSRFSVEEMEAVTDGFPEENVVGAGDNGVVYRGVLLDVNARVAVKRLLSNR